MRTFEMFWVFFLLFFSFCCVLCVDGGVLVALDNQKNSKKEKNKCFWIRQMDWSGTVISRWWFSLFRFIIARCHISLILYFSFFIYHFILRNFLFIFARNEKEKRIHIWCFFMLCRWRIVIPTFWTYINTKRPHPSTHRRIIVTSKWNKIKLRVATTSEKKVLATAENQKNKNWIPKS